MEIRSLFGAVLIVSLFACAAPASASPLTATELSQVMAGAAMESGDAEVIGAVGLLVKKRFFADHAFRALQPHLGTGSAGPVSPEKARELADAAVAQRTDRSRTTFQRHRQDGADHYFLYFEEAPDMGPMTGPGRYLRVQVNIFGVLVGVKEDSKPIRM